MAAALPLVIWRMPAAVQGFFFSFQNLATMFPMLELGLGVVIVQSASHYHAAGEAATLGRFWNFAWRFGAAIVCIQLVAVGLIGAAVCAASGPDAAGTVAWLRPWLVYTALSAAAEAMLLLACYIEGAVSPVVAWRFQRDAELLAGGVFLAALAAGAGLWSLPILVAARCACGGRFLWLRRRHFPRRGRPAAPGWWRERVWPFQWRVATGQAASFLLFRVFTPMVLVLQGPVAASRFGLSWALMSMLLVVFSGWPMSQAARFSRLATERDFGQLHRRFRTLLWASTGLLVLACLAILMLFWGLGRHVPALAERFAGLGTIALLLAAAVVQHVVACFGPYLRAERTDPLLKLSVAGSLATFVGCWFAARHGDIAALAATYLACSAAGLPYCLWRAAAMRKRWGASDRAA